MWSWFMDWLPWWVWYAVPAVALLITAPFWWPVFITAWNLLPASVRKWITVIGTAIAALFGAYAYGRNKGRNNELERQKQRDQQAEKRRTESDKRIEQMTPEQRKKEASKWYDH